MGQNACITTCVYSILKILLKKKENSIINRIDYTMIFVKSAEN